MKIKRSFISYKDFITLAIVILFSLILISSNQNRQIEHFKMWMVGMISGMQKAWAGIESYFNVRDENVELRMENTMLSLQNSAMHEIQLENERLRDLIGFKTGTEHRLIAARVIGRETRGYINDVILDIGSKDSVKKNMPLVVASGLAGKIYQVGESRSIGHLLLDQNFRVSAKIQRSRVRGIISWQGGDYCRLNNVPKRSDITIGDWVVTSGYGGIFPAGLRIGQVINIKDSPREIFSSILVKPAVDFEKLEELFVILDLPQKLEEGLE
ncbi:MAG: rod shape-determining protein MreC [Candidatus Zhuqueibacterota bacterium]